MVTNNLKSILLVDDEKDNLDMLSELMKRSNTANIVTCQFPSQAIILAERNVFDIILIDVTIDYLGTPFGGLDLYKLLLPRYGRNSLIAYSQFITDDLLKSYNYDFHFVEKGTNIVKFVEVINKKMQDIRKRQSCFVAMPFSNSYDNLFQEINKSIQNAQYQCLRIDTQVFTKSIIERIFSGIAESKVVVFVSNDRNPNAFYECGYADALNKEIVTITDYYTNLPFDIRDKNSIEYGNDLDKLKKQLTKRLIDLSIVN